MPFNRFIVEYFYGLVGLFIVNEVDVCISFGLVEFIFNNPNVLDVFDIRQQLRNFLFSERLGNVVQKHGVACKIQNTLCL